MIQEELQRKIDKAKLRLVTEKNTVFFSALLANLRVLITSDVATAATDGTYIKLNPEFILDLSTSQLLGLILHEVMHVVYEHTDRRRALGLNPQKWNMAGDYVINNDLVSRGYLLPDGGLVDPQYRGMSTRQVYDRLPDNSADGFEMDIVLTPGNTESEQEEHAETVKSNLIKAVTQAQMSNDIGSVPKELLREIDEILNPKLPWNTILLNHMSSFAKEDYTWSRPNKRFWPDFYMPGMRSEALNQITVAIDVSGSVSKAELSAFMAEIRYIWEWLKPQSMRLIGFDTRIHDDLMFKQGESLTDVRLAGGGGTNIAPVTETIRKDSPEVSIIFTDGHFDHSGIGKTPTDLFWIILGNKSFSSAANTVIHMNL